MLPDVVYQLAAVVSEEAETNFEKGYDANLRASWQILEALRLTNKYSRFIFSSSLAVYGPPFADGVGDDQYLKPASSYWNAKSDCGISYL